MATGEGPSCTALMSLAASRHARWIDGISHSLTVYAWHTFSPAGCSGWKALCAPLVRAAVLTPPRCRRPAGQWQACASRFRRCSRARCGGWAGFELLGSMIACCISVHYCILRPPLLCLLPSCPPPAFLASHCIAAHRPPVPPFLLHLQAALELQLKYSSGGSQLAALAPQFEEQQRALSRWEARLGRQLEAIVGLQKGALSARSSGSLGSAVSAARGKGGMQALSSGSLGENTPGGPMQTPAGGGLPFRPAGGL